MSKTQHLTELLVDMDEDGVLEGVRSGLAAGEKAQDILEALSEGMNTVGEKYGAKEYFLADLVMAAEIFKECTEILEPELAKGSGAEREVCGRMVIGTVKGDLHDIGKNIFVALARNAGFAVTDLGIDVLPEKLVEQVRKDKAHVLGLSGILTFSLDSMAETVKLLEEEGLRDHVKVIIGGLPVDERWCELTGADAFSDDAYKGLQKLLALMEVN
ncbi:MAG: cobalamin-dependent protein [Chloroflexota bacterium]|nr:cobalamin-dependent protein [Chloroflexota bacterium]